MIFPFKLSDKILLEKHYQGDQFQIDVKDSLHDKTMLQSTSVVSDNYIQCSQRSHMLPDSTGTVSSNGVQILWTVLLQSHSVLSRREVHSCTTSLYQIKLGRFGTTRICPHSIAMDCVAHLSCMMVSTG